MRMTILLFIWVLHCLVVCWCCELWSVEDWTPSKKVLCERFDIEKHGWVRERYRPPEWKWLQAVAWPASAKIFRGTKYFEFKRATVFCSRHCLSKNNMTRYARNLEGAWPPWLRLWLQEKNEKERTVLTWCSIFHEQKVRNNERPSDTAELRWKTILSALDATLSCYQLDCPQIELACSGSRSGSPTWCPRAPGCPHRPRWSLTGLFWNSINMISVFTLMNIFNFY